MKKEFPVNCEDTWIRAKSLKTWIINKHTSNSIIAMHSALSQYEINPNSIYMK